MANNKTTDEIARIYSENATLLEETGFTSDIVEHFNLQKKIFKAVGTSLPTRALCLGLGQLSKSDQCAYTGTVQLYAFKVLLEAFGIPISNAAVHDPSFTKVDKEFIRSCGYAMPETPQEALEDLLCTESTLVFNPFLPFAVLELVLKQNWQPDHLKNVILLGSKLSGWLNDHFVKCSLLGEMRGAAYIPRLDRCIPLLEVVPLTHKESGAVAFHPDGPFDGAKYALGAATVVGGFCFQWIPPYRVYAAGEQFWEVLRLEDSAWERQSAEEEEGKEVKPKKVERKSKL